MILEIIILVLVALGWAWLWQNSEVLM